MGNNAILSRLAAIGIALTAGGCATMSYILENYHHVPMVEFTTSHDTFRIFDKPVEGRLMITASLGTALSGGMLKGLTYGASGPIMAKPIYQEAVEAFLARSGRSCRITDGYILVDPQWEFRYECSKAVEPSSSSVSTAAAAPVPR